MSQATFDQLAGMRIAGVETGVQFAERMEAHVASGFGPVPVAPALAGLLPSGGLERGYIYGCTGDASLSLLFALLATPTTLGSWCALVNMPNAGLMSAHEHGVALQRVLCVAAPRSSQVLSLALGALVDGIDLVAVSAPACSPADARRIATRAKAQGAVVFVLGNPGGFVIDASFHASTTHWQFTTHAHGRVVDISASGRRVYAHRSCTVQLPGLS